MNRLSLKPLALAALLLFQQAAQSALPTGASVANGVVGINTFRDGMQVTNSPGAIINWNSFSISSGQTVRFDQLTAGSAVLNRVTGNSASNILGTLQSNGRVFLLNPNGIVFGAGARVDTAGLLASTLNISDDDFLAGNYRFSCFNSITCEAGVDVLNPSMNRIVLQDGSQITTRNVGDGGQVWLIARDKVVTEKGSTIDAPGGQVMAAAAREVSVSSPALGQMTFTLTGPASSQIDMAGDITVERGAAGFFADNVRLAGKVLARSEVDAAGQILAKAGNDITVEDDARLSVSGSPGADAGAIRLGAGRAIRVAQSVAILADGGVLNEQGGVGKGGLIDLTAAEIVLPKGTNDTDWVTAIHANGGDLSNELAGQLRVTETGEFGFQSKVLFHYANGQTFRVLGSFADGNGNLAVQKIDASGNQRFDFYNADGEYVKSVTSGEKAYYFWKLDGLTKGGWVAVTNNDINTTTTFEFIGADMALKNSLKVDLRLVVQSERKLDGSYAIAMTESDDRFSSPGKITENIYSSSGVLLKTTVYTDETAFYQRNEVSLANRESDFFYSVRSNPKFEFTRDGKLNLVRGGADGVMEFPDLARFTVTPLNGAYSKYYDSINELVFVGKNSVISQSTQTGSYSRMPIVITGQRSENSSIGYIQNGSFTELFNTNFSGQYDSTINCYYCESTTDISTATRVDTLVRVAGNNFVADFSNITQRYTKENNTETNVINRTGTYFLLTRQLTSQVLPSVSQTATVLTPPLLASQPGARNGVASTGGLTPPSGVGPTLPDLAPTTPAPVNPGAGVTPAAPAASLPPLRQGPAPRLELFEKPAPSAPTKPPAGVSAKAAVAEPLTPAQEKDLLESAVEAATDLLGKDAADQLATAKTPEQRGRIAQEMLYAMNVGPEMYDVTRDLNNDMRGALFTSLSDIQKLALTDDPALADGLKDALAKQRDGTNPDGSPRGTAMQEPLLKLQRELAFAFTPVERERVQRRLTRELINSAKEQAGETVDRKADLVIEEPDGTKVRFTEAGDLVRG